MRPERKFDPARDDKFRFTLQRIAAKVFRYTPPGSYFGPEKPQRKETCPKVKKLREAHDRHLTSLKDHFKVGEPVVFDIKDPTNPEPIVGFCVAASDLAVVIAEGLTFKDISNALTFPVSYVKLISSTEEVTKASIVVPFPLTPR